MVGSGKLDHARGAVYADHTALAYSQGELVTYSAVPTTHIEHRFVAVETVARQHGHRDSELNIRIGAVTARVPMCRGIAHMRRSRLRGRWSLGRCLLRIRWLELVPLGGSNAHDFIA